MSGTDTRGRAWLKKSEARDHMTVELDAGFTCASGKVVIREDGKGRFYFPCNCGAHYLSGQAEGDHYIGVYPWP